MSHSPSNNPLVLCAFLPLLVAACSGGKPEDENVAAPPSVDAPAPVKREIPLPDLALDRESLLVTMLTAAGSAMTGLDDEEAQKALNGRRFELRMRFGCPGADPAATRRWSFDQKSDALKVTVKPDLSIEVPGADEDTKPTTLSGFSVPRPLLLANGCPLPEYRGIDPGARINFALVQAADPDAPRARALLASYDIVKKISPEAAPNGGLDLFLSGRIEADTQGRTITCSPAGGQVRCLARATFDRIAIEDPASSTLVAEWSAN